MPEKLSILESPLLTSLTRLIERHRWLHRSALRVWRLFPPRLAGFLKGQLVRNWLVGAVAVIVDEAPSPPQILLLKHSYRPRGVWGLPGGSLDSMPGDPTEPTDAASADNVLEATLRREVWEELGFDVDAIAFLKVDAVPYVAEEPGPYRLDFYYRCEPEQGCAALRAALESGSFEPRSPEILEARFVPLSEIGDYDLFSSSERFIENDLIRLIPSLATAFGASVR